MFDEFVAWVQQVLSGEVRLLTTEAQLFSLLQTEDGGELATFSPNPVAYEYSAGMWVDGAPVADRFICAFSQMGGPAPDVDDRRQRYRVILLGPRNGREHVQKVRQDMVYLATAALGSTAPCRAAQVRAITEPVGPGYTTENRPFFMLDFEVLF